MNPSRGAVLTAAAAAVIAVVAAASDLQREDNDAASIRRENEIEWETYLDLYASEWAFTCDFEDAIHPQGFLDMFEINQASSACPGVEFPDFIWVARALDAGGFYHMTSVPSGNNAIELLREVSVLNTVGFRDEFSFFYALYDSCHVSVYSDRSASGTVLASYFLKANQRSGCIQVDDQICDWDSFSMPFSGIAHSVQFHCNGYGIYLDDLTFGHFADGEMPLSETLLYS